ncbi:MAG TPA: ShlB/FhaC/HecB family hemolysin secretion/activation protein [Stellaceae bacterium]|nr:ShlB/FhaC/HecB family hemolysin secretion/activation protein [Stellaceae bacterium]
MICRRRRVPAVARFTTALSLAAILWVEPAPAQVPPTASPVPEGSPIPRLLPPAPPSTVPGITVPPLPTPGELPTGTVAVTHVAIDGVTAYAPAAMGRLVQDLTGPAVPLARIETARLAILQRYRADGYVFTGVDADIEDGQLRFVVTEGHIVSVRLEGEIGPAGAQVLRFLKRLTEEPVIDVATLERYLLLAQDVPGVTLHAVLQPVTGEPGALALVAQVERKPVSGLATIDNRAFNEIGPVETLGVVDVNSLSRFGEKTEISYYHAFPDSENFGQASVETFIGDSGLKLRAFGGQGAIDPTGSLGAIDYHGLTTVFGGLASYPVIRSRQRNLTLFAGFDGLDSTVNIEGLRLSYDAVRAFRLGGEFAASDLLLGAERSATDDLTMRFSQGAPILGATADGTSPTAARLGEQASFSKLDLAVSRRQTLFTPWDGASMAVLALVTGQWTPDILPPSEQFYLGGANFTRGYYSGEVLGDKALAATAELQLDTAPLGIASQWYVFYDWGQTWQNEASDFATIIHAAGGGVRTALTSNVELDLGALERFNRFPTGTGAGVSPLRAAAFYWRVLTRF